MAISNVVTFRGLKKSLNTNNHNNSDFGVFFLVYFSSFFVSLISTIHTEKKARNVYFS